MMQSHRYRRTLIGLVGLVAVAATTGCYSRTIESEGLGTRWEQRDIYKPNVEKKSSQQQSQPKPRRKGGLFNNIGEFFFGSDDG